MHASSIKRDDREWKPTAPGHRTGEGSDSVLRYLHDELATKPHELAPVDQSTNRRSRRSLAQLASRMRRILLDGGQ